MTRIQWIILGSLVLGLIACIGVFGFLLGVYVFPQSPNPIAASNPTHELSTPTPAIFTTATSPERVLTPSRIYHLNEAVTDQVWEYAVTKVEKFKAFTITLRPASTPTLRPAISTPAQGKIPFPSSSSSSSLLPSVIATINPAQGIYIAVYLTLKNVSKQNAIIPTSNRYIEITDATGTRYDRVSSIFWVSSQTTPAGTPVGQSCSSDFASRVPGIAFSCMEVFDVNPSATGLKLHFLSSSLYVALE